MGKHFNAEVYRQFKPLQTAPEQWEPDEPVYLTDDERRQIEEWRRDRLQDEGRMR